MATSSAEAQANKPVTGYPVAYAYAVPVPEPQPQTHVGTAHYQYYPNRRPGSTLACRLIVLVIAIISIMTLASFISWLVLKPQVPEYQVDSASVSQLNTTSANSSLTATWQFSLSVTNPNKKLAVSYKPLQASVFYGESELSTTTLAPFSQEKRTEKRVDLHLVAASVYVGDNVVRGLESERARGEVEFSVRVFGWVRYESGWWPMRWHFMRVYCDGVKIGVSNNGGTAGNLSGRVIPCGVYL